MAIKILNNDTITKSFNDVDISVDPGKREFVAKVSTADIDRDGEVILPSGVSFKNYNRVILWGHQHDVPGIGRCMWIKRYKDPDGSSGIIAKGVIAKSQMADEVFTLMQQKPETPRNKVIGLKLQNL